MVLEALAAVGLAANILQFVEYSYNLVVGAREIRSSRSGTTAENDTLQLIANDLSRLSEKFRDQSTSAASSLSPGDDTISNLAISAKQVSDDLLAAIRRLRGNDGSHHKWHGFRQALKSVLKKEEISNIARRLEMLREQLSFHAVSQISEGQEELVQILKGLNSQCEAINFQQKDNIEPLLQQIVKEQRELNKVGQEEIKRFLDFSQESIKLQKEIKILRSLTFDMMKARYSGIQEAHATTFEWIFQPSRWPQSDPRSQIRFYEWLKYKNGLFWISGKPGSGKSTLMKYIVDCVRTKQCLEEWAGEARLAIPSFYFWIAGSEMQRCEKGLLQQLLFEILKAFPDWISVLCPERWRQSFHHMQGEWSLKELRETFRLLKTASPCSIKGSKICFFIDGLDEYDGDHLDLIATVESIADTPNMKICVSSRPWNNFKDALGRNPDRRLYLQDLTREDMATYTREKLSEAATAMGKAAFLELISDVVNRSQGVFLWVYLVVRSLRTGLSNGDSISLLRKRVLEFPSDLEDFFKKLIESVDTVYRKNMAYNFQVALRAPRALLLAMYAFLEDDEPFGDDTQAGSPLDPLSLEEATKHKLNGRYKGLLESVEVSEQFPRVDFLHRTVRDFLKTKDMQDLLLSYSGPTSEALLHGCEAFCKFARTHPRMFAEGDLEDFVKMARQVEDDKSARHDQLIEVFEKMDDALHRANVSKSLTISASDNQPEFLLCKAIYFGILSYADYRLQRQPLIASTNSAAVLESALLPHDEDYHLGIVDLLLKYGADPKRALDSVHKFVRNYPLAEPLNIDRLLKWREVLSRLAEGGASMRTEFICWIQQVTSGLAQVESTNLNLQQEIKDTVNLFIKGGCYPNQTVTADSFHEFGFFFADPSPWTVLLWHSIRKEAAANMYLGLIELFLQLGADPYAQIVTFNKPGSPLSVADVVSTIGQESNINNLGRQAALKELETASRQQGGISKHNSAQLAQSSPWLAPSSNRPPRQSVHRPKPRLGEDPETPPNALQHTPLPPDRFPSLTLPPIHASYYGGYAPGQNFPAQWTVRQVDREGMREIGPAPVQPTPLIQQPQWMHTPCHSQQQHLLPMPGYPPSLPNQYLPQYVSLQQHYWTSPTYPPAQQILFNHGTAYDGQPVADFIDPPKTGYCARRPHKNHRRGRPHFGPQG